MATHAELIKSLTTNNKEMRRVHEVLRGEIAAEIAAAIEAARAEITAEIQEAVNPSEPE